MTAEGHGRPRSCLQGSYLPDGGGCCLLQEEGAACYRRRGAEHIRAAGAAFRGRKSGDSLLEEVLSAPDPEEQVGRKSGRNAVSRPGARRGQAVQQSEAACCRMLGAGG